ncbi:MAG: prepilin-type N-terminal cleavage/methylation domain-containing protein [Deltaproteobacteria bacterium]|nr:prepilin-type N-terminal cleavage/methylation domain-containing protein [Deltaproteobacteria bacterium]
MDRRRGFTLLEVLVSLAILSSLLILAYRVVSGAIAAEDRSERWTTAVLLGEALLRETAAGFPAVQESDGKFDPPNDGYAWKTVVRQAVHPDAREVDVTVTWRDGGGEESVTLNGLAIK